MTRSAALVLALGLVIVAVALWLLPGRPGDVDPEVVSGGPATDSADPGVEPGTMSVLLYFLAPSGRLRPETRDLSPVPDNPEAVAKKALEELLAGSLDEELVAPLDPSIEVASVVVNKDAVVYVDFRAAEESKPPGSGSQLESLRVFSLVNTILGNLTTAESVVILWNGTQLRSLSGHLDMGRPLRFRENLVETSGRHDESG